MQESASSSGQAKASVSKRKLTQPIKSRQPTKRVKIGSNSSVKSKSGVENRYFSIFSAKKSPETSVIDFIADIKNKSELESATVAPQMLDSSIEYFSIFKSPNSAQKLTTVQQKTPDLDCVEVELKDDVPETEKVEVPKKRGGRIKKTLDLEDSAESTNGKSKSQSVSQAKKSKNKLTGNKRTMSIRSDSVDKVNSASKSEVNVESSIEVSGSVELNAKKSTDSSVDSKTNKSESIELKTGKSNSVDSKSRKFKNVVVENDVGVDFEKTDDVKTKSKSKSLVLKINKLESSMPKSENVSLLSDNISLVSENADLKPLKSDSVCLNTEKSESVFLNSEKSESVGINTEKSISVDVNTRNSGSITSDVHKPDSVDLKTPKLKLKAAKKSSVNLKTAQLDLNSKLEIEKVTTRSLMKEKLNVSLKIDQFESEDLKSDKLENETGNIENTNSNSNQLRNESLKVGKSDLSNLGLDLNDLKPIEPAVKKKRGRPPKVKTEQNSIPLIVKHAPDKDEVSPVVSSDKSPVKSPVKSSVKQPEVGELKDDPNEKVADVFNFKMRLRKRKISFDQVNTEPEPKIEPKVKQTKNKVKLDVKNATKNPKNKAKKVVEEIVDVLDSDSSQTIIPENNSASSNQGNGRKILSKLINLKHVELEPDNFKFSSIFEETHFTFLDFPNHVQNLTTSVNNHDSTLSNLAKFRFKTEPLKLTVDETEINTLRDLLDCELNTFTTLIAEEPIVSQTPVSVSGPIDDSNHLMWTEKFKPKSCEEIICENGTLESLSNWLLEWKSKVNNRTGDESSNSSYASSLDDEMVKCVLLKGDVGAGKTSLVYLLAKEHKFKVFEVNSSSLRSGKVIMSQLQEATQSHHVEGSSALLKFFAKAKTIEANPVVKTINSIVVKTKKKEPKGIKGAKMVKPKATIQSFFKKQAPEKINEVEEIVEKKPTANVSFVEFFKPQTDVKKSISEKISNDVAITISQTEIIKATETGDEVLSLDAASNYALKCSSNSIILFDDADVVFDEDDGFWNSVNTFIKCSKKPVILTASRNLEQVRASLKDSDVYELWVRNNPTKVQTFFENLCQRENIPLNLNDIRLFLKHCKYDLRFLILQLQFWTQFGLKTNVEQSTGTVPVSYFCLNSKLRRNFSAALLNSSLSKSCNLVEQFYAEGYSIIHSNVYNWLPVRCRLISEVVSEIEAKTLQTGAKTLDREAKALNKTAKMHTDAQILGEDAQIIDKNAQMQEKDAQMHEKDAQMHKNENVVNDVKTIVKDVATLIKDVETIDAKPPTKDSESLEVAKPIEKCNVKRNKVLVEMLDELAGVAEAFSYADALGFNHGTTKFNYLPEPEFNFNRDLGRSLTTTIEVAAMKWASKKIQSLDTNQIDNAYLLPQTEENEIALIGIDNYNQSVLQDIKTTMDVATCVRPYTDSMCVDYVGALQLIRKAEVFRKETNTNKRTRRFLHYFDTIGLQVDIPVLEKLAKSFE